MRSVRSDTPAACASCFRDMYFIVFRSGVDFFCVIILYIKSSNFAENIAFIDALQVSL